VQIKLLKILKEIIKDQGLGDTKWNGWLWLRLVIKFKIKFRLKRLKKELKRKNDGEKII